jgi:hypothetical protein
MGAAQSVVIKLGRDLDGVAISIGHYKSVYRALGPWLAIHKQRPARS